jgi:MFS superfamily sulfate permease-like transporter
MVGRRDTHSSVLRDMQPRDVLELTADHRLGAHYVVVGSHVTDRDDTSALEPSDDAWLTLVTCYPLDAVAAGTRDRFVAAAERRTWRWRTPAKQLTCAASIRTRTALRMLAKTGNWLAGSTANAALGLSFLLSIGALASVPMGPTALPAGIAAAFLGAVFGGLAVTLVSRATAEVSAPRASITILYAALASDLIANQRVLPAQLLPALALAVVLAGVLQIAAGAFRLGSVLRFLPYPVVAGFVTGTGLLVLWSQVGPLLGLDRPLRTFAVGDIAAHVQPLAVVVGVATMAVVWSMPRAGARISPLLIALFSGTVLHHLLAWLFPGMAPGPTVGTLAIQLPSPARVTAFWQAAPIDTALLWRLLPYAASMALQGALDASTASRAVSEIVDTPIRVNRNLVAQGVGNLVSGLIGGLPVSGAPAQSGAAARSGEMRHWVPAGACLVLLVAMVSLAPVVGIVPLAVLAGLLVTVGVGLVDHWTRSLISRVVLRGAMAAEVPRNLLMVVLVAGALFFAGVPAALLVGGVLSLFLLAFSVAESTRFELLPGTGFASACVWPPHEAVFLKSARHAIAVFRPRGGLFFGTADQLARKLEELAAPTRICILDCRDVSIFDASGCQTVGTSARRLAKREIELVLAGIDPHHPRDAALAALGIGVAPERWFADLDHALEWAEERLLRDSGAVTETAHGGELIQSLLFKGLAPAGIEVLRDRMVIRDCARGFTLFTRGTDGASLYVVLQGAIEVRIPFDAGVGALRRMAVFGPGNILGEIALLTGGPRSADAVCMETTRVAEIRREQVQELKQSHPDVYATVHRNLAEHLAHRLRATTDLARA